MSSNFVGEIRLFAGNYAPQDWVLCDGRMLSIQEYTALYSLIGTTYGGDGVTQFAVPDLRGKLPIGAGSAAGSIPSGGTSAYAPGEKGGSLTVTLTEASLPIHTHTLNASTDLATDSNPTGKVLADPADTLNCYTPYTAGGTEYAFADNAMAPAGGISAHDNVMPSSPLTYIIAVQGLYPNFNS